MRFKSSYLYIISAIEGFLIMGIEISGAKLLAPFFGNSLYVWATVISITMAGLAGGYFMGGQICKRNTDLSKILGYTAVINSVWLMLLPFLVQKIYLHIYQIPFFTGLFVTAFLVLFSSVSLLGLVSPILVELLTNNLDKPGHNAGKIFSISTFTGILATLLFGFFIIPVLGLKMGFLLLSAVQFLIFIIFFKSIQYNYIIALFWLALFSFLVYKINKTQATLLYQQEGIDGQVAVYEYLTECFGKVRELTVNHITQSLWTENGDYILDYVNLIYNLTDTVKVRKNSRALVLGMGGGTLADLLTKKGYLVDAVEFDKRIIDVAKNYLFLDSSITTYAVDARYFINQLSKKTTIYDMVIIDIFKGEVSPGYVLTNESLHILKQHLSAMGRIIINTHGYLDNNIGKGNLALINTLKNAGFFVSVHSTGALPEYRNIELFAVKNKVLALSGDVDYSTINIVLTDDKQQLEFLNAKANLAWRKGYVVSMLRERFKLNPNLFQ